MASHPLHSPPEALLHRCADHFGVTVAALQGPRGPHSLARVRHAAVWLLRALPLPGSTLPRSWAKIGTMLGDRDHSTLIHGWEKARDRRHADPAFAAALDALLAGIEPATAATPRVQAPVRPAPRRIMARNDFSDCDEFALADHDARARTRASTALLAALHRAHPERTAA